MTYLLLGEAPNPATIRRPDLWLLPDDTGIQHSANRLLRFTGMTADEYVGRFTRSNVCNVLPFSMKVARTRAGGMLLASGQGLICLGRKTASCFDWVHPVPYLTWATAFTGCCPIGGRAAVVPHPSGRNHWWDDEANRAAALKFFEDLR